MVNGHMGNTPLLLSVDIMNEQIFMTENITFPQRHCRVVKTKCLGQISGGSRIFMRGGQSKWCRFYRPKILVMQTDRYDWKYYPFASADLKYLVHDLWCVNVLRSAFHTSVVHATNWHRKALAKRHSINKRPENDLLDNRFRWSPSRTTC